MSKAINTGSLESNPFADYHKRALDKIVRRAHRDKVGYFHATTEGTYLQVDKWFWTTGFWPGLMRLALNESTDEVCFNAAKEVEDEIFSLLRTDDFYELHHDVGFQFLPTSVLRYKQTGSCEAKRRGIIAAQLLAARFNVASNVIEAWNVPNRRGCSIIDSMMNIPLLFWASETTGDKRYYNCAVRHIESVLKHFIRDDFTVHHIVQFDQTSGEYVKALGGQGYSADSVWSRGQSWMIYGLAIASRYTGNQHYKDIARIIADRFLDLNGPHGVPPWDFSVPESHLAPRDSSSAAIVACGLIALGELGDYRARSQAENIIMQLSQEVACFEDCQDGLLLRATSDKPNEVHVSDSLIYGDYFYFEALQKLSGIGPHCW